MLRSHRPEQYRAIRLVAVLFAIATSGCMIQPLDGHKVTTQATPVSFSGYTTGPGLLVGIEAIDPGTGEFEPIGSWTVSRSPGQLFDGVAFYPWYLTAKIPSKYWVRGLRGASVRVRAWEPGAKHSQYTFGQNFFDCYNEHPDASVIIYCRSDNSPAVDIATSDWETLPDITKGADCAHGTYGCNRCVPAVEWQFRDMFDPDVNVVKDRTLLLSAGQTLHQHIQGFSRLPDLVFDTNEIWELGDVVSPQGRFVITGNLGAGLFSYEQLVAVPVTLNYSPEAYRDSTLNAVPWAGLSVRTEGDLDHPGGSQAQGELVAVPFEGDQTPAEVRFYAYTGFEGGEVNRLVLDGSRGEWRQRTQSRAASVAFTRLADGHHLVFVAGAGNGTQGGWFYRSRTPGIQENTEWDFVGFWSPPCTDDTDGCLVGASGMGFVTDCFGAIYLITLHGIESGGIIPDVPAELLNRAQLWRLHQDAQRGPYLEPRGQRARWTSGKPRKDPSFRYGAGVYVSREGKLVVEATGRGRALDIRDDVVIFRHWYSPYSYFGGEVQF